MAVLLTRRAVVQVGMESTYNTPVALTTADGVLVSDPVYSADPDVLERDFVRDTLSQQSHVVGRMQAKMEFTTELRGNGKQQSGLLADAPIITRLFRACGYAITAFAAASASTVFQIGDHANQVSWATGGTLTPTEAIMYTVTCILGGPSATATLAVTSDTAGEGSAAAIVTSGTAKTIGSKGLTLTPTFTGSLVAGQSWVVWLRPKGMQLKPISTGQESITMGMNKDGVYHSMPGSYGTFEITAEAGKYASVKWTFMGTYVTPVDAAMVSPVYEKTLPAVMELAKLRIDDFSAIVAKFSFNQGNDVQLRPDVNSDQGYVGTRIVGRKAEGGIDPEADLVASQDFWGKLRSAQRMPFSMRIGKVVGNIVLLMAPSTQYTKMTYTDRSGILTYDAGLKFAGYQADDEIIFFFA